jgi:hypothetical protein
VPARSGKVSVRVPLARLLLPLPTSGVGIPDAIGEQPIQVGEVGITVDEEVQALAIVLARPLAVPRLPPRIVRVEVQAAERLPTAMVDNRDDAKDALDRITIPQDVLDRIAPTALPRSSIIVSDEPLSRETNYRTEFVAVLNNQPQGGFLMRRPTVDVRVASRNHWGNDGFGFFFQRNWNSQPAYTRPRASQYYEMQQRWW